MAIEEVVSGVAPMTPNAAQSGRADQTIPAGNQNIGQQDAPDFMSIIRKATVATAMSSEGAKYVKTVREYLESKAPNVRIVSLSYPAESMAFILGDQAIVLIFAEAVRREENLPTASYTKHAMQTLKSVVGTNVQMRNCVVVTPDDYCKAETMAAYLNNALQCLSNGDIMALNKRAFDKYNLEVSTNVARYDDMIRRHNPHGIPARNDLCLTISLNLGSKNRNPSNLFEKTETESVEIAAVGAYVRFVQTQTMGTTYAKFIPEVHISEITMALPFEGLLPVVLSMAAETLLDNRYWTSQFSNLGSANSANIGNLITDNTTGAPWRADNLAMRDTFIAQYCENPVLIIDVVEGRARIPGLEQFCFAEGQAHVLDSFKKFLQAEIPTAGVIGQQFAREYVGTAAINGTVIDSRWVDFLNMMIHHSSDAGRCRYLLNHTQTEDEMVRIVREFAPDLNLHYVNNMVLIQPNVLRPVQTIVRSSLKMINGQQLGGIMDTAALYHASQNYAAAPQGAYFANSTSPFGHIYGNLF